MSMEFVLQEKKTFTNNVCGHVSVHMGIPTSDKLFKIQNANMNLTDDYWAFWSFCLYLKAQHNKMHNLRGCGYRNQYGLLVGNFKCKTDHNL